MAKKDGNKFHQVLSSPTSQVSLIINQASISIWSNCRVIGLLHERTVNTTKKKATRWAKSQSRREVRGRKKANKRTFHFFPHLLSYFFPAFLSADFCHSLMPSSSQLPVRVSLYIFLTIIHNHNYHHHHHMPGHGCNDLF